MCIRFRVPISGHVSKVNLGADDRLALQITNHALYRYESVSLRKNQRERQ